MRQLQLVDLFLFVPVIKMASENTWRFVETDGLSGELNMAIDEAIFIHYQQGKVPPTLRFYTWKPATLSIGYFQRSVIVNQNRLQELGYEWVRRATGGRSVFHQHELTYSIVLQEDTLELNHSVIEGYRAISQGLLAGFQLLGLKGDLTRYRRGGSSSSSYSSKRGLLPANASCFDTPSAYELTIEGKKISGSAQLKHQQYILQHGSILLDIEPESWASLHCFHQREEQNRLTEELRKSAIAINQLSSSPYSISEVKHAFQVGLTKALGVKWKEASLLPTEWELAEKLVKEKYGTEKWRFLR
jgi:lipoate-protein ligase A